MKKKTSQSISVHIPVTMLASKWDGDFQKLPPNKTYELIIDYPLFKPAVYKISTGKNGMGLVRLLGIIGKLYQKTYDREDATSPAKDEAGVYGIHGHDIGDLNLSGISVNHKTLKIRLSVDS
jgi:hypothetical protein